mgnify:CR=1 FL=1
MTFSLEYQLKKLYDQGILHQDIKKDNVIIREGLKPVLADYGEVKFREKSDSEEDLEKKINNIITDLLGDFIKFLDEHQEKIKIVTKKEFEEKYVERVFIKTCSNISDDEEESV